MTADDNLQVASQPAAVVKQACGVAKLVKRVSRAMLPASLFTSVIIDFFRYQAPLDARAVPSSGLRAAPAAGPRRMTSDWELPLPLLLEPLQNSGRPGAAGAGLRLPALKQQGFTPRCLL
jgi:hypothetical protein